MEATEVWVTVTTLRPIALTTPHVTPHFDRRRDCDARDAATPATPAAR